MATTTTNNKRTPYHTQRCLCYELLNARGALRACVSACWVCTYLSPWVSTYVLQEHRVTGAVQAGGLTAEDGLLP